MTDANQGPQTPPEATPPPKPPKKAKKTQGGLQRDETGFYDITELPSRGIPYDGRLPNGTVEVRAMTAQLQKQIASLTRRGQTEVLDKIVKAVLKTDFDTDELTSADRAYIMLFTRIISYPSSIKSVRVMNPHTNEYFEAEIDLREIETAQLPDDWQEPHDIELPMSREVVSVRAMRGSDELAMAAQVRREKVRAGNKKGGRERLNELLFGLTLRHQIVAINGEEKNDREKQEWVDTMLAGDIDHLRDKLEEFEGGVNFAVEVEDPDTGHLVEISLISGAYNFMDPT